MGFYGFGSYNGLAIEFNPSWSREELDCISESIYDAVMHFADHVVPTIWLIDYHLKAKDDLPAEEKEPSGKRKVWYGGDGCRFLEMYSQFLEDGGEHLKHYYTEGIDGENSTTAEGSCHEFIEKFEWYHFGDIYERQSSGSDNFFSRFPPYAGILACLRYGGYVAVSIIWAMLYHKQLLYSTRQPPGHSCLPMSRSLRSGSLVIKPRLETPTAKRKVGAR